MNTLKKNITAGLAAIVLATAAQADETQKHVALLVDLNGSDPARDPRFAAIVAKEIVADITKLGLGYGDRFSLRSAGDRSPMAHLPWAVDETFAHGKAEPNDMPRFLRDRFTALASEPAHSGSDIIGALSRLSSACSAGTDLSLFVVSNMIDEGRVEGDRFVYPSLPGAPFKDCNAQITLLGFGMNAGQYDVYTLAAAKEVVTTILTDAGFARVTIK